MNAIEYMNGVESFWSRIYIAGNYDVIEAVCREYCTVTSYCVNVTRNNYIYRHGEQSGAVVELINYPRFPETSLVMVQRAEELAKEIANHCHQRSYTIMTPTKTFYYERK